MGSQDFQKRLLETFRVEAREHVAAMESYLDAVETVAPEALDPLLEGIFRAAHSLKGAARAVDLRGVERICQELETRFSTLRKENTKPDESALAVLHAATDRIAAFVEQDAVKNKEAESVVASLRGLANAVPDSGDGTGTAGGGARVSGDAAGASRVEAPAPAAWGAAPPQRIETTRTATTDLDRLFRKSEEVFSTCMVQEPVIGRIMDLRAGLLRQKSELERTRRGLAHAARGDTDGMLSDQLSALENAEAECAQLFRDCSNNFRQLRHGVSDVLDAVKRLQMLPIRTAFESLPRLARNLARDCGKQVRMDVSGDDIRIDKHVLDNLADPLVHLLRNCVDHGIEPPQDRRKAGKPETGTIRLSTRPIDASSIEILISDDGRGINLDGLRARAVSSAILNEEEAASLSERDSYALAFRSGLSTSPMVTDLSGRGLGLAIVQEKVAALGGTVRCEAAPNGGTSFVLRIPLTITTTRVIAVGASDTEFFIPGNFIAQGLRISAADIQDVAGHAVIQHRARAIRVGHLRNLLGLAADTAAQAPEQLCIVVLRSGDQEAALIVDEIGAEREVIVKPLGPQLVRVPKISGGSLGPGGKVVLVLDAPALIDALQKGTAGATATIGTAAAAVEAPLVLVVDDSVTSRTLLRDIMKSSGYRVETAVDGMEALARLREHAFDLVVSDVDMPRLNGFELVRKIRHDKKLEELPVILVTSLDSREDRERGMEVGASAYIVKTSFEQSNLLEVAQRFV